MDSLANIKKNRNVSELDNNLDVVKYNRNGTTRRQILKKVTKMCIMIIHRKKPFYHHRVN